MTKLVLIRHAQSLHNANAIIGGNPEITEKRRNQAEQAGRDLYEKYGNDFNFMVISGMLRTNQTAEIINQYLRINIISYNRELQEKRYGIYENKALNKHMPDIYSMNYNESIPGGESEAAFVTRITNALCGYLKRSESFGILVTHGYVIKMATKYFLDKNEDIQNAGFIELDIEKITDFAGKCESINSFEISMSEL